MADLNERDAKLVQYLSEAYGKERELEDALQAHIAMTVKGPYKKRLQQHLKAVKLETAVVFVGDVGELDDFLVRGERARGAGMDRRSAARAGGKSDGAELHPLAHHFFLVSSSSGVASRL